MSNNNQNVELNLFPTDYAYTLNMIADAWVDGNPHWLTGAMTHAANCNDGRTKKLTGFALYKSLMS